MEFTFDNYYTDAEGNEHSATVLYDYSPAEYGFPAMIELCEVSECGCNVIEHLTTDEYHRLELRAWDDYHARGEREEAAREDAAEARAEMMREERHG